VNIHNKFLLGGIISAALTVDDNENKREGLFNILIYQNTQQIHQIFLGEKKIYIYFGKKSFCCHHKLIFIRHYKACFYILKKINNN